MPTLTLSQIKTLTAALEQFRRERAARLQAEERARAVYGEQAQVGPDDLEVFTRPAMTIVQEGVR